jgi:hypothetical protein
MNYQEAEDILRKNLRPLPRTWSEARRDADYACAVDIPQSRTRDATEFLMAMLFIVPLLSVLIYFIYMGLERLG